MQRPISDYDRVARAIDFVVERADTQPGLDEIAAHVALSPFHFQRLFSRWAGTTPKRFLQALTLERAKRLMDEAPRSLLEISDTLGLSSSSRLYDHFVQLEAVTPAQYARAGLGLAIAYGIGESPFGPMFVAASERGIVSLSFLDHDPFEDAVTRLVRDWPKALIERNDEQAASLVGRLFSRQSAEPRPLSLLARGTNFQLNVWRALLAIPPGTIVSYARVAEAVGRPAAARAVGAAVAANPLAYAIPCHRVIMRDGGLGGYRWGRTRKQAMLAIERALRA